MFIFFDNEHCLNINTFVMMMKNMKRKLLILFLFSSTFFFSQKKSTSCYDLKTVLNVEATPLYQQHLDASKKFKINLLKDSKDVTTYNNKGKISKVKTKSKGYKVQQLDYSRPYLVSQAKTTLENIAARFSKDNNGSLFTVTSITRTLEDQCRLRKVNSNASLGISSHNYGNSFDISYIRFNGKLAHNKKLDEALLKVLQHYKEIGRIYFIKEKQQNCYHVTVRKF